MTGSSDRIQTARDAVEMVVADYEGENRIQELSLDLLAEIVSNKIGEDLNKSTISWHLAKLNIALKLMKKKAKENRVKQLLTETTDPIASKEVREILLSEKFEAGESATCALVARIRKEIEKQSGKASADWEIETLKTQIKEAIHYIENRLYGKVTCPKIAHHIMKNHEVMVSDHLIKKVRKMMEQDNV